MSGNALDKLAFVEKCWNDVFLDFLNQMETLFPDSPASSTKRQMKLQGILNIGTKPIVLFIESVKNHEEEIISRNDHYFFSEHSKIDFVENLNLKVYFGMSSDHNKKTIWDFIVNLYTISTIYKI